MGRAIGCSVTRSLCVLVGQKQVEEENETWGSRYRGWPMGIGFGTGQAVRVMVQELHDRIQRLDVQTLGDETPRGPDGELSVRDMARLDTAES